MTTDNASAGEELDLNALAEFWMSGSESAAETAAETETAAPEGEGEEESSESSNEAPTQQAVLTPEMRKQILDEGLTDLAARAREVKAQRDLKTLMESGTAEEVAEWARKTVAENQDRVQLEALVNEKASEYAEQLIKEIITPEFVESLTDEDAAKIDPDTFEGTDAQYLKLLTDIKAEKARGGLFDEAEVERRVAERAKGQSNVARGAQLSAASITQTPGSSEADRHAGKSGANLQDSLWEEVEEGWRGSET